MQGIESTIEATLLNPETVVQSRRDPTVQLYYRLYAHPRVGEKYVCVVVKLLDSDAFVLTAYITDRIKQGAILWPRS